MSEELDRAIKTARDSRAQVERLGITPKGYEEKDRYIMLDEIDSLRSSNAALKADNEALKNQTWGYTKADGTIETHNLASLADALRTAEAKLSLYTSWQPSDPGTKEAMAFADALTSVSGPPARVKVLAAPPRAAGEGNK